MLRAVTGAGSGTMRVPLRRALLSVTDKTNLEPLARELFRRRVEIVSTGGTAKQLREWGVPVRDVSDLTGFPEVLSGRVKSLHPKVHGGLLAVRGNAEHEAQMLAHGIEPIDLVVSNLYAFHDATSSGADPSTCVENIDIGGPSMLRSAAKNHAAVSVISGTHQYEDLLHELAANDGATTFAFRQRLAAEAFRVTAAYDAEIADWMAQQTGAGLAAPTVTRAYTKVRELKYGCNPHQKPAFIATANGGRLPFKILSGAPGYINLLDAVNAWQLVAEMREGLGLPAAASFKHVSPAGAAIGLPLEDSLAAVYEANTRELSPVATAYLRARNADPMSSFGDFVSVSDVVDRATAELLKNEVSDGIIAPGYEPAALEILKAKKKGAFIVLEADRAFRAPDLDVRELFGVGFIQKRNDFVFTPAALRTRPTKKSELPPSAERDLLVASIAVKFTQSNSVGYALGGQMVGIGAGQQSRVDCVKLAGRKLRTWYLRQHPKVMGLPFKSSVKRQARVNARVRYIEGDFTPTEYAQWVQLFERVPEPLTEDEKRDFFATLSGVSLASDAFFPFRDSIDIATQLGVQYIAQPGGSVGDEEVVRAADDYGMTMAFTGVRTFHH